MTNVSRDLSTIGMDFGNVTELLPNVTGNTANQDGGDCLLFTFILYSITMGLTCILGFAGNSISFVVLSKDDSTPVASFLLKALAVADNCFLVLWMIHYSVRYWMTYFDIHNEDVHPSWLYIRVYSFPVLYMAQTLTIWLPVVVSLNRFMAVCLPYKAPHLCNISNVYKEVSIVTAFSILYNIPRFFELAIVQNNSSMPKWNRTELWMNHSYRIVYSDALYYIFSFFLPLLILLYVNTRVIIAYRRLQARKKRMSSRRSDRENNITLVMIVVVVIFMLCQAPARIVQLAWNYLYTHCREYQYYLIHISNTFEVLNSSINFIIYYIFHKRFKQLFVSHFCCSPFKKSVQRETGSIRGTAMESLLLEEGKSGKTNKKRSDVSRKDKPACLVENNGNVVT